MLLSSVRSLSNKVIPPTILFEALRGPLRTSRDRPLRERPTFSIS